MKKRAFIMFGAAAVAALMVFGCGKSDSASVDVNKPVAQVKTEAEGLNVDALKQQVEAYQKELEAQKPKLAELEKKLKDTPLTQALSQDTIKLKEDITAQTGKMSKITERLNIYADELKKKSASAK